MLDLVGLCKDFVSILKETEAIRTIYSHVLKFNEITFSYASTVELCDADLNFSS